MQWQANKPGKIIFTTKNLLQPMQEVFLLMASDNNSLKQRTTNNEQQTTNNKQRTTNNKQRTTNNEQQTTNNKQRTTNNEHP
jgi:hypothetical protein